MAVNLSPVGGVAGQFFDNSGNPLTGGKLYSYAAGTTTPQTTYTSSAGSTAHANPIVLDAGGRVPGGEIWLTDGSQYKFVLKNSSDVLIGTYDNIVGINSNFINFTNQQEIQTATASQTVFTLATMQYQPGTGSLSVFVDGVNQYGPSALYAFTETSSTVVTFTNGLHVGASVKFTTSATNASSYGDASQITYTPAGTGAVATNVQAKLRESVSVLDFGAVGDGSTDDTTALQTALTWLAGSTATAPRALNFVAGAVYVAGSATVNTKLTLSGAVGFSIFGNGATIKAGNSRPVAAPEVVLLIQNCTDGYVESLFINGNRANRTPVESTSHCWHIYTSTARLTFFNCQGNNSTTDGFLLDSATPNTLGTLPTDIHFINCSATNAYRNNLSLINSNRFRDDNGLYTAATGTSPQAGVDCEPNVNTTQGNQGAVFNGTECSRNVGQGFSNALSNSHVKLFNIIANGNGDGGVQNAGGSMLLDGFSGSDYTDTIDFGVVVSTIDAVFSVFKNMFFSNITATGTKSCVQVGGGTAGNTQVVDGITAENVDCALLVGVGLVRASNIIATNYTFSDSAAIQLNSYRSTLTNVNIQQQAPGEATVSSIDVIGADCVVDGVILMNPGATSGGTMGAVNFLAGAVRGTLRNVSITQLTAIPAGQRAVKFIEVPLVIENVSARSAGTNYTATTVMELVAGASGAAVRNISPSPFSVSQAWNPASIANGASESVAVTVAGVGFGMICYASFGISTSGMTLTAAVSAANTITATLSNNTGGAVDLASSTLTVWAESF